MERQNVKWQQMSAEDAIIELNTNAACGLSRKAARSRAGKYGSNTLFDKKSNSFWKELKPLMTDPSWLLLLFAELLAICFFEIAVGISALICTALGVLLLTGWFYGKYRFDRNMTNYQIPTVRTLRDGRKWVLSARSITVGDVILLKAGDVVPADCRLCDQSELLVYTLLPGENGEPSFVSVTKNADTVYPYRSEVQAPFYENMLYGGSEIVRGTARAVVTAVGNNTFLGSFSDFSVSVKHSDREKRYDVVREAIPYLRFYSLLLWILFLPVTALSFLIFGKQYSIFRIFLPICAWVASASIPILLSILQRPAQHARESCLSPDAAETRAVLKSPSSVHALASVTDLFVMGSCCVSDGCPHLFRASTGRGEVLLSENAESGSLQALCEAYLLFSRVAERKNHLFDETEAWDDRFLKQELIAVSGYDVDAMEIRLRQVSLLDECEGETRLKVLLRDDEYELLFTVHHRSLYRYAMCEQNGKAVGLSAMEKDRMLSFIKEVEDCGGVAVTVVRQRRDHAILLGILAIREELAKDVPAILDELCQCGVRTTFFMNHLDQRSVTQLLSVTKASSGILIRDMRDEQEGLIDCVENSRFFLGFTPGETVRLIRELQRQGRKVAVIGNMARDLPLLGCATQAIACDPTAYHKKGSMESPAFHMGEDGFDHSSRCAQAVRCRADVLIPRASATGGGLLACLEAILHCRRARLQTRLLFLFLMASHGARLIATIMSIFLGITVPAAAQMLFGSVIIEVLITALLLRMPLLRVRLNNCPPFHSKWIERVLTDRKRLLPIIIGSSLPCLYAFFFKQFGGGSSDACAAFLFCSTVLLQITVFFVLACPLERKSRMRRALPILAAILIPIAIAILSAMLFPSVQLAVELGEWHFATILALPIAPLCYLVSYKLFQNRNGTAK